MILRHLLGSEGLKKGKTSRISYKVKKSAAKSPEDWVRVEGTHAPIVSKADYIFF
jgi:hypothetical protein